MDNDMASILDVSPLNQAGTGGLAGVKVVTVRERGHGKGGLGGSRRGYVKR